jgi:hypothetical protein
LGFGRSARTLHPERTDERYCTYDERHRDYGYKKAYVEKLVREASTSAKFTKLTGKAPRERPTGRPPREANTQPGEVFGCSRLVVLYGRA